MVTRSTFGRVRRSQPAPAARRRASASPICRRRAGLLPVERRVRSIDWEVHTMARDAAALRGFLMLTLVVLASPAHAVPITLRDSNGTRYNINTDVSPLINDSNASGAVTDATFQKPVTVTSYFVGFTFFGFTTVYTVQRQVNVPLRNAFAGFNGLLITGINGTNFPNGVLYNPGETLASEDCPQDGTNRQLTFQTQSFPALNLQVARKVFVPNNG